MVFDVFNNHNYRVIKPLEAEVKPTAEYSVDRVFKACLPLLVLYQPFATTAQIGAISIELLTDIRNTSCIGELLVVTYKVTTIAFLFFKPILTTTLFHTADAVYHLYLAYQAREYKDKGKELLKAAHSFVYVATIYTVSPEIWMISLVSQACFEVYRTYCFAEKGMKLEAVVQAIVTVIRGRAAFVQTARVKRNWFGSKLTQERLDQILSQRKTTKKLDLRNLRPATEGLPTPAVKDSDFSDEDLRIFNLEQELAKANLSNYLEDLDFSDLFLHRFNLSHIHVRRCNFQSATMTRAIFDRMSITDTRFDSAVIIDSRISNSSFIDTSMRRTTYKDCHLDQVRIMGCDMTQAIFFGTQLSDVNIVQSILDEANFFYAFTKRSTVTDSLLTNTILADTTFDLVRSTPVKTKPVIALETDLQYGFPEFVQGVSIALQQLGATVLYYPKYLEQVDDMDLKDQVDKWALQPWMVQGHRTEESIPSRLLRLETRESEIEKIKLFSLSLIRHIDGVVIPGGENVEPIFYGKHQKSFYWEDYHHDMMQFAVVNSAYNNGRRIMGVCRGSQLINVFFGGTLRDVPHQSGFQKLEPVENVSDEVRSMIDAIVGDQILGASNHYQASDQIGRGLEVALKYDDIPKALMNKTGTVLLTQFHPEVFAMYRAWETDLNPSQAEYTPANISANDNFYNHFLAQINVA